jgi:hypothetical protein
MARFVNKNWFIGDNGNVMVAREDPAFGADMSKYQYVSYGKPSDVSDSRGAMSDQMPGPKVVFKTTQYSK